MGIRLNKFVSHGLKEWKCVGQQKFNVNEFVIRSPNPLKAWRPLMTEGPNSLFTQSKEWFWVIQAMLLDLYITQR